jgi:hypothetical protein
MGETRSTHDGRDKSTQHFGRKTVGVHTVDVVQCRTLNFGTSGVIPTIKCVDFTFPQNCADPSSRAL